MRLGVSPRLDTVVSNQPDKNLKYVYLSHERTRFEDMSTIFVTTIIAFCMDLFVAVRTVPRGVVSRSDSSGLRLL